MASRERRREWSDKLRGALTYRALDGREERWRHYISLMAHRWYDGESQIANNAPLANYVAARARAVAPKLAMGTPGWQVRSVFRPYSPNSEPALAAALALLWRTENCRMEMKRITDDYALFGPGIGFVGYEERYADMPIEKNRSLFGVIPLKPGSTLERLADALPGMSDEQVESVRQLLSRRVFLKRVSPLNYVPDPTASHVSEAGYSARRLFLLPSEAKSMLGGKAPEPKSVANVAFYENVDPLDPLASRENNELLAAMPDAVKRCVVWELWDIDARRTVYLDDGGTYLADFEWRSAHPGSPLIVMNWDDVPDVVYSEGLGAALEPINRDIHIMRDGLLSAVKSGKRKYRASDDMTRDQREALESEQDGAVVYLGPEQFAEPLQFSPMPADLYAAERVLIDTLNEVSNTSQYDTGQAIPGRKSATESAFIQATSDAMISYRQGQVEAFVSDVGERMLAALISAFDTTIPLIIQNRDPALVISDTGITRYAEPGETIEYDFVPIQHAGLYSVAVDPGSLVAQAKDMERANYISLFDRFSAFKWFDAQKFASHVLGTMPGIRNPGDFIISDAEAMARASDMQVVAAQYGGGSQSAPPLAASAADSSFPGVSTPPAASSPSSATDIYSDPYASAGDLFAAFRGANAPNVAE